MNYITRRAFSILAFLVLGACSVYSQGGLTEKDKASIKRIKETYRVSWLRNDKEKILSLFAGDAAIYPNGLSPQRGSEAVAAFWFGPGPTQTVINEYQIVVDEIDGERTLAFAVGSSKIKWTMTDKSSKESKRYASTGNFLTVFSKRGGEWKIVRHIWNGKFEEIGK